VAETPKPHLISYRERAVIDGHPIDAPTFARLAGEVLAAADGLARRHGPATEFEVISALTFRWCAEQAIDVALVEVGLGGRLDATHAWDGGVAVVTNVGLDHTDRLGPTIRDIAREKAAIIERGDLAVTAATGEALAIVRRRCRRVDVPLRVVEPAPVRGIDRDGIDVDLAGLGPTRVGLRGRHQAANVAVADALLDALAGAGTASCGPEARRVGYAAARWPGRLELVEAGGREILLDGAHNPDGAAALAAAYDELAPFLAPGRPTLLLAAMGDKDVPGIIGALAGSPALARAHVVTTTIESPRALSAGDLALAWEAVAGGRARTAPDPVAALEAALAQGDGPVVVAGSLYLVGAVRGLLVDDPELRDPPDTD
jgi:dihydrofolate synthase/folylpolyglutamate synthase